MMSTMTPNPPPARPPLPVATIVLVAANVAVWLLQVLGGLPWLQPSSEQLVRWGADMPALTLTGDGWRLATSMFLHGGLLHLALNMSALAFTGPRAQHEFGTARMLLIYLAGGLLASCASTWWAGVHPFAFGPARPLSVSVGASGAIMALFGGLLAAALLGLPYHGNPAPERMLDRDLLKVVAVNVGAGFLIRGVDQAAHVGGLLAGFAIGCILSVAWRRTGALVGAARLAAIALLLGASLGALFHAGDRDSLRLLRVQLQLRPADAR